MIKPKPVWVGLALSVLVASCGESAPVPEIEKTRPKLVLIGVDGATWDVIDPMLERGELPNLAKLIARGTKAPLISLPPLSSPVVWTSIATGKFPREHGILGFTYPFAPASQYRAVSSDLRQEPAIWNIATEYGKRVSMVGYFVTHPPEIIDGFMASDLFDKFVPGSVFPGNRFEALRKLLKDSRDNARLLKRFLPWDYKPSAAQDPNHPQYTASLIVSGRVDDVLDRDDLYRRTALELTRGDFDLQVSYYRVVDHCSHATWRYFDDSEFEEAADPSDVKLLGNIIPEAYRYIDDLVGEYLDRVGEDTNILIVSDHGFGPAIKDYEVREGKGMVLSGNHRTNGIFLAAGPDIRHGQASQPLTIMEIAPLMLTLLGIPVSEELPGRIAEDVLRPGYFDEYPLERVSAYEIEWSAANAPAVSKEEERETLDMLANLGYIDEDLEVGEEKIGDQLGFWEVGAVPRGHSLTGELAYYALFGKTQAARELFELAKQKDSEHADKLPGRVSSLLQSFEKDIGLEAGSLTNHEVLRAAGLEE